MIQIRHAVITTYDLEPIRFGEDLRNSISLRIEILQSKASNRYISKLWRFEFFRIRPTFPNAKTEDANDSDEMLLVEDDTLIGAELDIEYDSSEEALNRCLFAIAEKFKVVD